MPTLLLAHNTPESIISGAEEHGFSPVLMPPMADMAPPVASHPDMLLFAGFGRLFVRDCHLSSPDFKRTAEVIIKLTSLSLSPTSDSPSAVYPADVAFNSLYLQGTALIGKADYLSGALKRAATEQMIPIIDTAQGYAKCSSCLIGKDAHAPLAVITADPSIYRTVRECGVRAAKITPGHVSLPGYDTGFIGGASFYHDGTLYFLGNIDFHPDHAIIKETADSLGVNVISLSDEPLFDAGCLLL